MYVLHDNSILPVSILTRPQDRIRVGGDSDMKMFLPPCPERLTGPPSLVTNGYLELYPLG